MGRWGSICLGLLVVLLSCSAGAGEVSLTVNSGADYDTRADRLRARIGPTLRAQESRTNLSWSLAYVPFFQFDPFGSDSNAEFSHRASGSLDYRLDRYTQIRLTHSFRRTERFRDLLVPAIDTPVEEQPDDTPTAIDTGTAKDRRTTFFTTAQVSRRLSSRWSWSGFAGHQYGTFSDPTRSDFTSLTAGTSIDYELTDRDRVGFGANYSYTSVEENLFATGSRSQTFNGSVSYRRNLTRTLQLSFSGGPAWVTSKTPQQPLTATRLVFPRTSFIMDPTAPSVESFNVDRDADGFTVVPGDPPDIVDATTGQPELEVPAVQFLDLESCPRLPGGGPDERFLGFGCRATLAVDNGAFDSRFPTMLPGPTTTVAASIEEGTFDLPSAGGSNQNVTFFGRASLSQRWRNVVGRIGYTRREDPATGSSSSLSVDRVSASLNWEPRDRWELQFIAAWNQRRTLTDVESTVFVVSPATQQPGGGGSIEGFAFAFQAAPRPGDPPDTPAVFVPETVPQPGGSRTVVLRPVGEITGATRAQLTENSRELTQWNFRFRVRHDLTPNLGVDLEGSYLRQNRPSRDTTDRFTVGLFIRYRFEPWHF